jgi:hypothetical protein
MIRQKFILIVLPLLFVTAVLAKEAPPIKEAQKVFAKEGNVYYVRNGREVQVTFSGRDEYPMLHPNKEWIYFVRTAPGKWVGEKYYSAKGEVTDGVLRDELWRVKTDGTGAAMLFRSENAAIDGPDPDYAIASVNNIQFSPNGDKVYFEASQWVTSDALYIMNADGSAIKMLGPGNDTKIVLSARTFEDRESSYEGYIVTAQHRYFFYGGSYDWYYLFTPDMKKEIAPLGDDFAYFTETGEIKYTDKSEMSIERSKKLP